MTRRIQKLVMAVAALAALALGGAVFAQAQTPTASQERTSAPDRDNVRSGDQTTPDKAASAVKGVHAKRADVSAPGDNVQSGGQSGDQSTPDAAGSTTPEMTGAESPESSSESATPNDGPGGHADPAGSTNADHQFQGNE
mgnify:CR=1 FL=1